MEIKKIIAKLEEDSRYVASLNQSTIVKLIEYADLRYEPGKKPVMYDIVYNSIKDRLRKLNPKHKLLFKSNTNDKVKLPVRMPSLDKVSDSKGVVNFINNYEEIVIEDKHDGLSLELVSSNSKWKLYSRGDSDYGQDLTHLVKYINLPKAPKESVVVRAEIQLKESIFKEKFKGKNSRNTLSGFFTRKANFKNLKYASVIAYQLICNNVILKPQRQLILLKEKYNFQVPKYRIVKSKKINFEVLKKYLLKRKKNCEYNIDGIVLLYNKKYSIPKSKNPKYSVKFKLNFDYKTTIVKKVVWQESSHSKLSPVILLKPVKLKGVTVSKVTGFNYKFINDNGIGKGAVVRVCRSGDVIPDLRSEDVIKSVKPDLPKVKYRLSDTKVHAYTIEINDTVKIKRIDKFFRTLKVEEFSVARIKRFYDAGFNTVTKILNMSKLDIASIKGFNTKSATTIYNNIHSVKELNIVSLMYASSIFGDKMGGARLAVIVIKNRDKIANRETLKLEDITSLEGFKKKLALEFITNLPKFYKYLSRMEKYFSITIPEAKEYKGILNNIKICFTGFRDKKYEEFVTNNGGDVVSSVSSKTNILVRVDSDYDNKKTEKAKSLSIPIVEKVNFHNYCINNFNGK